MTLIYLLFLAYEVRVVHDEGLSFLSFCMRHQSRAINSLVSTLNKTFVLAF